MAGASNPRPADNPDCERVSPLHAWNWVNPSHECEALSFLVATYFSANMHLPFRLAGFYTAACLLLIGQFGCSDAARKARHLQRADRYFASGQYDSAEIEYRNVLRLEPMNPDAIARLGLMYFDQGRISRVQPFLNKARELRPNDLAVRIRLALFNASVGKTDQAREEIGFVLDREPLNEDALLLLGETAREPQEIEMAVTRLKKLPPSAADSASAQVARGMLEFRQRHLEEAQTLFERALTVSPDAAAANMAMATLHIARGNLAEADKSFAKAVAGAPRRSAIPLRYAQFKLQIRQADAARKIVEEVANKTSDYLPAWVLLGQLLLAEKNYDACLAAVGKVLERDPMHPEALLMGPQARLAKGDHAAAIANLERVVTLYPKSPQPHQQLGMAYAAIGEFGKAMASLGQASVLAPDMPELTLSLAELNIRQGNANAAVMALKQLVAKRPKIPAARLLLAQAYRAERNPDQAIAVYEELADAMPRDPQAPFLAGLVKVEQKKLSEARLSFTRALERNPAYLPAVEQLVNLDLTGKQFAAALERVQAQLGKNPKVAELHLLHAKAHLAAGNTNDAEAALQQLIALAPENPAGYFLLAQLYVSSNQREQALNQLQVAVGKNPKDINSLHLLAAIHEQGKNYAAARENYERVVAINPRLGVALNNLAYLYSEQFGEIDKAFELAQRARELFPREPHLADTLGWVLHRKRQYPWALTLLLESAEKLPNSPDVQYHLGMTHYMMGEEKLARAALERAIALDPKFSGINEARTSLAVLAMDPGAVGRTDLPLLEKVVAARADPVALLRLGSVHENAGDLEKAASAYKSALAVNAGNVTASLAMIRVLVLRKEMANAIELAKATRKLAPDDPKVAQTLGRLALATRDYRWAFSLLQESARKLSDSPELLYVLAEAAYANGQVSTAETSLRDALRIDPLFPQAAQARRFLEMVALAADPRKAVFAAPAVEAVLRDQPSHVPGLMAMAAINERNGNHEGARHAYRKSLEQYPDFSPAQRGLTLLNARAPIPDRDSVEIAAKARAAFPDDPELAKASGIILCREGDYARALALLQQSSRQRPSDPEGYYFLGIAQMQLNDRLAGIRSLQRALELGLHGERAAEARRLLAPAS